MPKIKNFKPYSSSSSSSYRYKGISSSSSSSSSSNYNQYTDDYKIKCNTSSSSSSSSYRDRGLSSSSSFWCECLKPIQDNAGCCILLYSPDGQGIPSCGGIINGYWDTVDFGCCESVLDWPIEGLSVNGPAGYGFYKKVPWSSDCGLYPCGSECIDGVSSSSSHSSSSNSSSSSSNYPIGYSLLWKCAFGVFLTDRTMSVMLDTTIGGAINPRVSWHQYNDSIGTDCGTFGNYISAYHATGSTFMYLDIWEALRDGIWSESITIPVYLVAKGPSPSFEVGNWDIVSGNYIDNTPHVSVSLDAVTYSYVSACTTPFDTIKYVTFYDSGIITVSNFNSSSSSSSYSSSSSNVIILNSNNFVYRINGGEHWDDSISYNGSVSISGQNNVF